MGRRSTYNAEIADEICRQMSDGKTLGDICAPDEMPPRSTVIGWAADNVDNFASKYARAREMQGHAAAENAVKRALQRSENPQADRLEFDALRWFAGKVAPRHYGDKVAVGGDPDAPAVQVAIRRIVSNG
jgi:hypothetical protein